MPLCLCLLCGSLERQHFLLLFVQHGHWKGMRCVCTSLLLGLICPVYWKKIHETSVIKINLVAQHPCCFVLFSLKSSCAVKEAIELQSDRSHAWWILISERVISVLHEGRCEPEQEVHLQIAMLRYDTYVTSSELAITAVKTPECIQCKDTYTHLTIRPWSGLPRCRSRSL